MKWNATYEKMEMWCQWDDNFSFKYDILTSDKTNLNYRCKLVDQILNHKTFLTHLKFFSLLVALCGEVIAARWFKKEFPAVLTNLAEHSTCSVGLRASEWRTAIVIFKSILGKHKTPKWQKEIATITRYLNIYIIWPHHYFVLRSSKRVNVAFTLDNMIKPRAQDAIRKTFLLNVLLYKQKPSIAKSILFVYVMDAQV